MKQFYQRCSLFNLLCTARCFGFFLFAILSSHQVLAQFVVTNTLDGHSSNQLRGAIEAADAIINGTSTITVNAGTYNLTLGEIQLGSHPQNITITGAGAATTIINMTVTAQDRIFLINPPGTISNVTTLISGITFNGGHATTDLTIFGGGALACGGPNNVTTFNNCVFSNNTSTTGLNGGAIYMNGGGTLTLNQCTFTNNVCPKGSGGALYYFKPNSIGGTDLSGILSITDCSFNNNSVTEGGSSGGAIEIGVQGMAGTTTHSISILRNNFVGNHADATGKGGAISITNSFSSTNTASINYNRFSGNTATNASTSALAMSVTVGSVNATNNWWGCNTGPGAAGCADKAAMLGAPVGGTLNTATWLRLSASPATTPICSGAPGNTSVVTASFLKNSADQDILPANLTALVGLPVTFSAVLGNLSGGQAIQSSGTATVTYTASGGGAGSVNAVVDAVPNTDAVAKASITVNASPSISAQPAPTTNSCAGNTASFTVTASGASPTYQWFKGATALVAGATGTGSTISGVTSATLTIVNASAADNATNYNVVISNTTGNSCKSTSNNASLTVAPPALAGITTTGISNISGTNITINDPSCLLVAKVNPSGGAPVSGNVTAKVTVDASQPTAPTTGQPYVIRHYDITPAAAPNTATATITLYFLQSEFNTYNAAMPGTVNDLPTGPSDAAGIANLRVTQYHGTTSGNGPGTYSGWAGVGPANILIDPNNANIVWNNTLNRWEITFDVTGFSGFYITGLINYPLPIRLESFTGTLQGSGVLLSWVVSEEINVSHYEVQQSEDGIHFKTIENVTATNKRNYSLLDNPAGSGSHYYRLKIIDNDGQSSFSNVISVGIAGKTIAFYVSPNPFRDQLQIHIDVTKQTKTTLTVTDISGKVLLQQNNLLAPGLNTVTLNQINRLVKGTYMLHLVNDEMNKTVKIIKGE